MLNKTTQREDYMSTEQQGRIVYRLLAGYKGCEWNTGVTRFRSRERAEKALKKLKGFFGNATMLTLLKYPTYETLIDEITI